jgi:hypothetical protein
MTYQGARAQPLQTESRNYFSVSQIRLDGHGRATHVLWSEVNPKSNLDVAAPVVATADEVVDALNDGANVFAVLLPPHAHGPEQMFEARELEDGSQTIALVQHPVAEGAPHPGLRDLASLEDETEPIPVRAAVAIPHRKTTYAVSQVALDPDGRVTAVRWGRVNTVRNAWAGPESIAAVSRVVEALESGDHVYALFPALHGHLPERTFIVANYDNGLQTIVFEGPVTHEREVHDMDRMVPGTASKS